MRRPTLRIHVMPSTLPLLVACVLTGCGGAERDLSDAHGSSPRASSTSPRSGAPTRATVYFLADGQTVPLGVRRDLTRRPAAPTARLALEELLDGPTPAERENDLSTAIPAAARIRSLRIERRTTGSEAFVDLSGLPAADDADVVTKARVLTQVARTLIGLDDIERVRLRADGRAWGLWDLQGQVRDDPVDYRRLRGFFHICTAVPGTEAVPGDCFTALP